MGTLYAIYKCISRGVIRKWNQEIAEKPWQIAVFHYILVRDNGYDEDSSSADETQSEPGMVRARREYRIVNITSEHQAERFTIKLWRFSPVKRNAYNGML